MTDRISPFEKPTPKKPGTEVTPETIKVAVAKSKGHRGKVRNITQPWRAFIETLKTPARDTLTWAQYDKLSKDEQMARKASAGYFVGGHFADGVRQIQNISHHSMATLDCDQCSAATFLDLTKPNELLSALAPFEYFLYTTRSHRKGDARVRVLVPFARELTNDEYVAATRILAHRLDATMMTVDPVTFRAAQVMYMPTANKDAEFVAFHNPGRLLDGEADVLDTFPGWEDWQNLPKGERDKARPTDARTENAMEKRGWVGAYCRARSILEQLNLMDDIYTPVDGNPNSLRWSFIGGKSTDGAVVYPEDGRMTSHHGSDPANERASNTAFDLELVHRFGELDKGKNLSETDPREWPSYIAMIEALQIDEQYADVREVYANDTYNLDAMAADAGFEEGLLDEDDDGSDVELLDEEGQQKTITPGAITAPEIISKPEKFDIIGALDKTDKMAVKRTVWNTRVLVKHDPRLAGRFAYNEFIGKPVMVKRIRSPGLGILTPKIRNIGNGDLITSTTRTSIRALLSAKSQIAGKGPDRVGWGYVVPDDELKRVIEEVAQDNSFHPIRRYIEAIEWDGVPRLDTFFEDYCHQKQNVYYADVGRFLFVAAVTRVYEPGAKYDSMVMVEGQQECGKSSMVEIMAVQPEWFGAFMSDVSKNDKVIEGFENKWIIEWPELSSFGKAETNQTKAIISAGKLTSRVAYKEDTKDYPMQCVMIGTTNDSEYLKDRTGNRRYLPIRIPDGKRIDLPALRRDIHQLWAEAREVYHYMRRVLPKGELRLMVEGEAKEIARRLQGEKVLRGVEDDWFADIEHWLETEQNHCLARGERDDDGSDKVELPRVCCIATLAHHLFNFPRGKAGRPHLDMIARCLDRMPGFTRSEIETTVKGFGRRTIWTRDENGL